jgi:hypothetical protein
MLSNRAREDTIPSRKVLQMSAIREVDEDAHEWFGAFKDVVVHGRVGMR